MLRGFFAEDDGQPQGGDTGKTRASDLRSQLGAQVDEQALTRLLEKHADLLNDNSQLREQRRNLKQQLADAASKLPGEGARVLTKEEGEAYDAYAALNLKPADVQAALAERDEVKASLATIARADTIRTAAEAHGYKVATLSKLPSLANQAITVEDVTVDGKPVKRAYVTVEGKKTALPDYIQAHDAEFLPALTDAPRGDGVGSPTGRGARPSGAPEMRSPGITI